jgi:hypothetical protein
MEDVLPIGVITAALCTPHQRLINPAAGADKRHQLCLPRFFLPYFFLTFGATFFDIIHLCVMRLLKKRVLHDKPSAILGQSNVNPHSPQRHEGHEDHEEMLKADE